MSKLVALIAPLIAIAPYYLYYPQIQKAVCERKVHKPLYEFLNTYTGVCAPASPTVPKLAELPLHDVSISLKPGATLFNRPSGLDASFRVILCAHVDCAGRVRMSIILMPVPASVQTA